MMNDSSHDSIGFHLAKLLDEHLLRNRGKCAFQVREAQHFAAKEMKQDQQFPATLQNPEDGLDALSGRSRRECIALTFR